MLGTRKNLPSSNLVEAAMSLTSVGVTALNLWHCDFFNSPGYNQTSLTRAPLILNLQEFRYDLRIDSCWAKKLQIISSSVSVRFIHKTNIVNVVAVHQQRACYSKSCCSVWILISHRNLLLWEVEMLSRPSYFKHKNRCYWKNSAEYPTR